MRASEMESCIAEGQWGGKDNGILQVSALTEYHSVCNSLSMAWRGRTVLSQFTSCPTQRRLCGMLKGSQRLGQKKG